MWISTNIQHLQVFISMMLISIPDIANKAGGLCMLYNVTSNI